MKSMTKSRMSGILGLFLVIIGSTGLVLAQTPTNKSDQPARSPRPKVANKKAPARNIVPARATATQPSEGPDTQQTTSPPADPIELLKAIPADATAFLAIRNLDELDRDIINLAHSIGFPLGGPNGIFPGPLDWVKEQIGLSEGTNTNASLALVLLNCRELTSVSEISTKMACMIPCTDTKAVLAQLDAAKEGDVSTVTLGGQPYFAAPRNQFLVLAQSEETLRATAAAKGDGIIKSMAPDRIKAFADKDLYGWANLQGFSPKIREEVNNTLSGLMAMAGQGNAADANESIKQLNKFVEESDQASFGLSLDHRGIDLSGYFRMKPDSEMGKQMAAAKGIEGTLLFGLPNEPTLVALGAAGNNGTDKEKQTRQALDQTLDRLLNDILPAEQLDAIKTTLVKVMIPLDRFSAAVVNLPSGESQGLAGMTIVLGTKNSKEWIQEARKLFSQAKEVVLKAAKEKQGRTDEELKVIADAIQWKNDAEQIGDINIDHLSVDLGQLPTLKANPEALDQLKTVLGPDGLMLRVGTINEQTILVTFGGGTNRFARIAEQVAKGGSPLADSENIQKIAKRLPPGPKMLEAYINIDQILNMVTAVGTKTGQPMMPLNLKNSAPVAVVSNKVDETAQEFHLLIPTELVQSAKDMLVPIMPLLMGGGMGGTSAPGMDMEMNDKSEPAPAPAPEGEAK